MTIQSSNFPTIKPALTLDFANSKRLDPRIAFARGSQGTYVDSDGLLKTAASGVARFTHDPITGESLGLLVEEQRVNLLQRTEEFDNAVWSTSAITLSPNTTASPDGQVNAETLASLGTSVISQSLTKSASAITYAASLFVKTADLDGLSLTVDDGGTVNRGRAVFDLTNDSVTVVNDGNFTGSTGSLQRYSNGWARIVLVTTTNTGTSVRFRLFWTAPGSSIDVWGAQLEAGAFPTSYIKNVDNPLGATRAADVVSISGSNFSSWYRQDEGTVFVDAFNRQTYDGTNRFPYILQFDDGSNAERISLDHSVLSSGYRAQFIVRDNDANTANITAKSGISTGLVSMSAAYGLDSFAASANGGSAVTDSSGTLPTVDGLQIGLGFGSQYNGTIRRLTYWPQRLPNETLQTITQ